MDREMARVVDSSQCGQEEEPVSYRRCRGKICSKQPSELSVQWHAGSWGRCSSTCDTGDQVKDVYCAAIETGREPYKVDDFLSVYGCCPDGRTSRRDRQGSGCRREPSVTNTNMHLIFCVSPCPPGLKNGCNSVNLTKQPVELQSHQRLLVYCLEYNKGITLVMSLY
ncbi:hypothetical protein FSP39_009748 [Pinctada imbricata]|uniref:Uncharacterized protein n=1 Tax=Pinctada imbricata TaxID=66713 RepID=A0AA88Y306_PINIB|nr:hypothetical protein FSP39_009748 [Pinctada imbricata]